MDARKPFLTIKLPIAILDLAMAQLCVPAHPFARLPNTPNPHAFLKIYAPVDWLARAESTDFPYACGTKIAPNFKEHQLGSCRTLEHPQNTNVEHR
jgi:hypothetical protein